MTTLDLAVIGIVFLSALFAFARGFVREALSIVAWVGAAYITFKGFDWVYRMFVAQGHPKEYVMIRAKPGENKFLLNQNPAYYVNL